MTDREKLKIVKRLAYEEVVSYYKKYCLNDASLYRKLNACYDLIRRSSDFKDLEKVKKAFNELLKKEDNSIVIECLHNYIRYIDNPVRREEIEAFPELETKPKSDVRKELEELNMKIDSLYDVRPSLVNEDDLRKNNLELAELLKKRKLLIESNYHVDGTFVWRIESLEKRLSKTTKNGMENDSIMNANKYVSTLRDIINNYSLFKTKTERKKLLDKYNSMILSLFHSLDVHINLSDNPEDYVTPRDLITYVGIYNIDGNYMGFENRYKGKKIASDSISREIYLANVNYIKHVINELCSMCHDEIMKNDNAVTVSDYSDTREGITREINDMYNEMYQLEEVAHVHR